MNLKLINNVKFLILNLYKVPKLFPQGKSSDGGFENSNFLKQGHSVVFQNSLDHFFYNDLSVYCSKVKRSYKLLITTNSKSVSNNLS